MSYLEVKDNKDLQEVVRSIKAEKDLVTLVSAYEDFLGNFSCKPDRDEFPYPDLGMIIDEEKSVKWNREELYRQRAAFEARVEDLNKYKNLIDVNFKEQLNRLLAKDNHITIAENKMLFNFADDMNHSYGIRTVISTYEDLASLYKDLLDIHDSKKKTVSYAPEVDMSDVDLDR